MLIPDPCPREWTRITEPQGTHGHDDRHADWRSDESGRIAMVFPLAGRGHAYVVFDGERIEGLQDAAWTAQDAARAADETLTAIAHGDLSDGETEALQALVLREAARKYGPAKLARLLGGVRDGSRNLPPKGGTLRPRHEGNPIDATPSALLLSGAMGGDPLEAACMKGVERGEASARRAE